METQTEKFDLTFDRNKIKGLDVNILGKHISTHNLAGRRVDIWFEYDGKYYWGYQYGIWNTTLHCKRLKRQPKRFMK